LQPEAMVCSDVISVKRRPGWTVGAEPTAELINHHG
jgi:hypothetical protein